MPDRQFFVYGLTRVDVHEVRYVGVTSRSIMTRLNKHRRNACCGPPLPVYDWMNKYGSENVIAIELQICASWEEVCQAERDWITVHRCLSTRLLNLTDGGEGWYGRKHSLESREKIRQARARQQPSSGWKLSVETRQKLRDAWEREREHRIPWHKGKTMTEEQRSKLRVKHRKISVETRQRMAEARRGRPNSHIGSTVSAETRAKISATLTGRPGTPATAERKAKISAANKGRVMSAEARTNMSIAQKQRQQRIREARLS